MKKLHNKTLRDKELESMKEKLNAIEDRMSNYIWGKEMREYQRNNSWQLSRNKDMNPQIQRVQSIPRKINKNKSTPGIL